MRLRMRTVHDGTSELGQLPLIRSFLAGHRGKGLVEREPFRFVSFQVRTWLPMMSGSKTLCCRAMGVPRTTRRARSDTRSNTLTGDQQSYPRN